MADEEYQESPRNRNVLLAPVRLLLHGILKITVVVALTIRFVFSAKLVRYGLVALLVVGGVAWNLLGNMVQGQPLQTTQGAQVVSVPAAQLPQSLVVERYLTAQAAFDAKGMWDAISDELKQQMSASDISAQQLQQELDSAKQQGRRYRGANYVGGMSMSQGRAAYFYVLSVDTPMGSADVPYIYVTGSDGKIVSIQ